MKNRNNWAVKGLNWNYNQAVSSYSRTLKAWLTDYMYIKLLLPFLFHEKLKSAEKQVDFLTPVKSLTQKKNSWDVLAINHKLASLRLFFVFCIYHHKMPAHFCKLLWVSKFWFQGCEDLKKVSLILPLQGYDKMRSDCGCA